MLCAKVVDLLANATNHVRERVGTCLRTARVQIKRGKGIPPRQHRQRYSSSVGNFSKRIFSRRSPSPDSANESERAVPREQAPPACYYDCTAMRAREALALSYVDKDLAPRAIPKKIITRKSCARAYVHLPARSSMFGKLFPAAAVASKSHRPNSRSRPQNRGNRRFRELFWPKPVVAQGQGRVDCRSRVPREHSSPRRHPQGQED